MKFKFFIELLIILLITTITTSKINTPTKNNNLKKTIGYQFATEALGQLVGKPYNAKFNFGVQFNKCIEKYLPKRDENNFLDKNKKFFVKLDIELQKLAKLSVWVPFIGRLETANAITKIREKKKDIIKLLCQVSTIKNKNKKTFISLQNNKSNKKTYMNLPQDEKDKEDQKKKEEQQNYKLGKSSGLQEKKIVQVLKGIFLRVFELFKRMKKNNILFNRFIDMIVCLKKVQKFRKENKTLLNTLSKFLRRKVGMMSAWEEFAKTMLNSMLEFKQFVVSTEFLSKAKNSLVDKEKWSCWAKFCGGIIIAIGSYGNK